MAGVDSGDEGCPVCGASLGGLSEEARERHVNECLDRAAAEAANPAPPSADPQETLRAESGVYCPVCGASLGALSPDEREAHAGACLDAVRSPALQAATARPGAGRRALGVWLEESGLGDLQAGPLGRSGLDLAEVALLDDAALCALGLPAAQRQRVLAAACTVPLAGPALGSSPAPGGGRGEPLAVTRLREAGSPLRSLWGYSGTGADPQRASEPLPTLEGHPEHCRRTGDYVQAQAEADRRWLREQSRVVVEEAQAQQELASELERIHREAQQQLETAQGDSH